LFWGTFHCRDMFDYTESNTGETVTTTRSYNFWIHSQPKAHTSVISICMYRVSVCLSVFTPWRIGRKLVPLVPGLAILHHANKLDRKARFVRILQRFLLTLYFWMRDGIVSSIVHLRSKSLWQWYININIVFLDIIHGSVFILNKTFGRIYSVSVFMWKLLSWVQSIELVAIDWTLYRD
jgi:hypothetical protein